jgi:hypothetical protein
MREGIAVEVSKDDRERLEATVADRNSRQKHVWRARIVLLTADGLVGGYEYISYVRPIPLATERT